MAKVTPFRIAVAFAAVLLAIPSALASAALVVGKKSPELALQLWPPAGFASARASTEAMLTGYVQREKEPGSETERMRRAAALARRSLDTLALNPESVRTIGIAEYEGKPGQAAVMEQAARLSRRDSITQIWLIDNAARANQSRRALDHYDALLRRDTPFRDIAGRTLAHALAEPSFVDSIGDLLRADPPWKTLLYHYAVRDPAAWDGFLKLHGELDGDAKIPSATSAEFAAALAAAGRVGDASRVAKQAGAVPLVRTDGFTDSEFAAGKGFPGNWNAPPAQGAQIQPLAGGGALLSYVRGRTGVLAQRLIALAPGTYSARLALDDTGNPMAAGTDPQVSPKAHLSCVGNNTIVMGSARLTVGTECPYQWLSIVFPEAPRYDGEVYLQAVTVNRGG